MPAESHRPEPGRAAGRLVLLHADVPRRAARARRLRRLHGRPGLSLRRGPGEAVAQGQLLGLSGDSGPSTAPHLHLDVQSCGPNLPPRDNDPPCGMTVPLSFRNTQAHACGLQAGRTYTALPFVADGR